MINPNLAVLLKHRDTVASVLKDCGTDLITLAQLNPKVCTTCYWAVVVLLGKWLCMIIFALVKSQCLNMSCLSPDGFFEFSPAYN